jgi:hypothetical protein
MTGPPVTDTMTKNYWQWAIGLTDADFGAGNVITTDPGGSGVAFLMDPRDALGVNATENVSLSAGMLSAHQPILIPLWIALADNVDGLDNSQLNVICQINHLLGNIKSHVNINGANVLSTPFLNVDVCEINPTTVNFYYNPPTLQPGTTLYQHTNSYPTGFFNFTMLSNSHKYLHPTAGESWTLGFHTYATTSGLWAVISPSDAGLSGWSSGNIISYDTTVAGYTHGGCMGTPYTYGPVTVTYNVT